MDGEYSYRKLINPEELHIYRITMADNHPQGGWYSQLTSMDSFLRRIGGRWYNQFRARGLFIIQRGGDDYPPGKAPYKILEHHFTSVWDFYKWIGFDYKDKTVRQLDKLITEWRTK